MLQELFLLEEKKGNIGILVFLGIVAGSLGFFVSRAFFPTQSDVLTVVFAAIPLIFSMTRYFYDREGMGDDHIQEYEVYLGIFTGLTVSFALIASMNSGMFQLQKSVIGLTGEAFTGTFFYSILSNNLGVFLSIMFLALVLGSAGAFVLSWNASVLGVFIADLLRTDPSIIPLYLPHTFFEMTGFIIAGVAGTLISAAIYQRDWEREVWLDYAKLVGIGLLCILLGAIIESA